LRTGSNDPYNYSDLITEKENVLRGTSGKGEIATLQFLLRTETSTILEQQQKLKKLTLSHGNIVLILRDETSSPVLCSSCDVVTLETKSANFGHSACLHL
jgi:hypothetical protein